MVDKQQIFAQISEMEEQMGALYSDLGKLKTRLVEMMEHNRSLQEENDQLRRLLKKTEGEAPASIQPAVGEGYDNLARIYNEGFHVCNVYYGRLRTEGDCLFCLSFLTKDSG